MKVFKNALVNGKITDIVVENGKIKKLAACNEDGIDIGGRRVLPGFIDIHIHGAMGKDTMDGNGFNEISMFLAQNGVTSFLATTMTVDMEDIKNVVNGPLPQTDGAQVIGYHLEGPYINESRRGAQNIKYIRKPDIEEFEQLENILLVTVAPEVEGGQEFIKKCKAVVAIGHTDADYETSLEAINNGAKCLTHTFNAMTPLNHRFPGPIGAAVTGNAYAQVICDGFHIHPAVVLMLYRVFGKERMILISDSIRAAGMDDGLYDLGGLAVKVENGIATTLDGVVAGSTSNLLLNVKNAIKFGIPEEDAIYMATETPAKMLNLNKGRLQEGFDADFIVVDDQLNIEMTVVGGRIV